MPFCPNCAAFWTNTPVFLNALSKLNRFLDKHTMVTDPLVQIRPIFWAYRPFLCPYDHPMKTMNHHEYKKA